MSEDVKVRAVTPSRWRDLEALFGPSGAYSGCWCMWFRETSAEFDRRGNAGNKRALASMVRRNGQPGLLAYVGGEPAGWVSVAPREEYGRIERSALLKRVDDAPVWSVVCFFIDKRFRGRGLGKRLLDAAVDHARRKGAQAVEAYPRDPRTRREIANADAFVGLLPMFEAAGFREVARRKDRPIVRREVRPR
jgi:GNAT superfamily N-acetyltransferase